MKYILVILTIFCTIGAQNPLIVPPVLSGTNFNLTIQESEMEFYPGVFTQTMGVSFPILGPTLIMEKGDYVNVTFDNQLSDTTTIHWHGMHVPAEFDGGPHTPIPPNSVWNPQFEVKDHASTMWYHPHLMHKTNKHVQMGIAGFVIVKDDEESELNLPREYGVDDFPVVFQTKTLNDDFQIVTDMDYSGMDTLLLVNATKDAYLEVPAQIIRLRLLNGSSERSFNIALENGDSFYVIATDGGLIEAPVEMSQLLISPGERYEVLVNLNGMDGEIVNIVNMGSNIPSGVYGTSTMGGMGGSSIPYYSDNPLNGGDFTLLELRVIDQNENAVISIPESLVSIEYWDENEIDEIRNIQFSPVTMGPDGALNGPFTFNGDLFDLNVVNYEIPFNNVEIWQLSNQTLISHPFHMHMVQFNILEIDGNPPPDYMIGWKDVVLVPPNMGTVKFITKFNDYSNENVPYMYHCHILTHEEEGMMGQFTVVGGEDTSMLGDLNEDGLLNVQDIILVVNLILTDEYNPVGDLNEDGGINVLDVVGLVNIILGNTLSLAFDDYGNSTMISDHAGCGNKMETSTIPKEASLYHNTLCTEGEIGGIQVRGILISKVQGDDIVMFDNGKTVIFNLKGILDTDSFTFESTPTNVIVASSSGDEIAIKRPPHFTLSGAYPNPFNPSTSMNLNLPIAGFVNMQVVNLKGQVVSTLLDGYMEAGNHTLTWNAMNMTSGMYFVKVESSGLLLTQKIMFIK